MVDGSTDFAFSVGKPAFRQHLALVSGLNTHIFLLYLMYLRVGSVDNLMDGRESGLCRRRPLGRFSTSSKRSCVLPFPAASSKTRSVRRTFFMGIAAFAASSRSVAWSERSMYFPSAGSARSSSVNCRREDGRCLAQNHPAPPGCQPFPPFVCFSSHGVPPHAGEVSRSASGFFRRSGQLRFRLPAADMFHLARGKVFRYRTVTGHFLRDLIGCFQFPHRQSPSFP